MKYKSLIWMGLGYIVLKWTIILGVAGYLYELGIWSNWFILVVPLLGVVLFRGIKKVFLRKAHFLGYRKSFYKILKQYYPENYRSLFDQTENRYGQISKDVSFSTTSKNPMDKRLDFCAFFLGLIQVLEKKGEPLPRIKMIAIGIAEDYVRPKNWVQAYLKKLPVKLIGTSLGKYVIGKLNRRIQNKGHEDGFRAHILTDKKETFGLGYGINISECGICKLFLKHQASKYTPILCEVDKITTNLAGLKMVRTGTIATGANVCDFRYKKI